MRHHSAFLQLLVLSFALALPACTPSNPSNTAPTAVASIAVSGAVTFSAAGQTGQLTATATLSDGSTQVITGLATWQSTDSTIAAISPAGVLTTLGYGKVTVTATYQGVTGLADITVALDMNGTWKGSATDSLSSSQYSVVMSQNGGTITGALTGTVSNSLGSNIPFMASFTGTVTSSGASVAFTISGNATSSGGACAISLSGTGQVSNITFTSAYSGSYACLGPVSNGQVTLTRQ